MKMKTANCGTWRVHGINLISSDSIYKKLENAIQSGNLEISYLQKVTGHLSPISVDKKRREIKFLNF